MPASTERMNPTGSSKWQNMLLSSHQLLPAAAQCKSSLYKKRFLLTAAGPGMQSLSGAVARITANHSRLQEEHGTLEAAVSSNITPEERRMVWLSLSEAQSSDMNGGGRWHQCRSCGLPYFFGKHVLSRPAHLAHDV